MKPKRIQRKRIKKFKLKGYKEAEWFWVYIYDSLKEMREDASQHVNEKFPDALAITSPLTRIKINTDKSEKQLDNIGIIRFVKDKLHTHIVAHELVHAAMHHYRLTRPTRIANFGKGNNEHEEAFGIIYAKYFSKMSRQLYRFGFWK